jgi:hypothetical protein
MLGQVIEHPGLVRARGPEGQAVVVGCLPDIHAGARLHLHGRVQDAAVHREESAGIGRRVAAELRDVVLDVVLVDLREQARSHGVGRRIGELLPGVDDSQVMLVWHMDPVAVLKFRVVLVPEVHEFPHWIRGLTKHGILTSL